MMHHANTAANLDQRAKCVKLPRKVRKARGRRPSPSYWGLHQGIGQGNGMRVAAPPAAQRQAATHSPMASMRCRCGLHGFQPPIRRFHTFSAPLRASAAWVLAPE